MDNFKVSAKRNGKWWNFGSIKKNQYGNLQLSFKNTQELKEFVNKGGDWLNFSLFEDKPKEVDSDTQERLNKMRQDAADSEIPF